MSSLQLTLTIAGRQYRVEQPGRSIAIALHFDGPQPNTYGVAKASAKAYASGGWVGDTQQGGSCNFETYTLTPHCNGTHTECVGHIVDERLRVHEYLRESLLPATLISVTPCAPADTPDSYDPPLNAEDRVIDRAMLEQALKGREAAFREAIVIRTLPNGTDKLSRDYMVQAPTFFTLEGMAYLASLGVEHLLVDFPSVDRLFDEGKLRNHRTFWDVAPGVKSVGDRHAPHKTITELVFAPNHLADGIYLLNLQVAPFMADAAPSRPVLYPLQPI